MKNFLRNILTIDNVVDSIENNMEDLCAFIPEIKEMVGFDHKHPHHIYDVWEHTLCALNFSSNDFEIRLALLLHDIGKPYCFYEECGVRHFHGHGDVSADMSYDILTRLGFEKDFIFRICEIVRCHDVPLMEDDIIKDYDISKIKFNVQICDALAHNPEKNAKRLAYIEKTNELFKNIEIFNIKNS